MRELVRSVLWQRLDLPGGDHCSLWRTADGWRLEGIAVVACDGALVRASYEVECERAWRTRSATLLVAGGATEHQLHLRAGEAGRWSLGGEPAAAVTGCPDVDLNVTPATNTLAIRRLNLAVGESAEVVAAWVRFPELTVEPLWQRYTRLDERRYDYESAGGFATEITADDLGLLVDYVGGWRRVSG